MDVQSWTHPNDIKRAIIHFPNRDRLEIEIENVVSNSESHPLWITYRNDDGLEVIIPWVAIRSLTVLTRIE